MSKVLIIDEDIFDKLVAENCRKSSNRLANSILIEVEKLKKQSNVISIDESIDADFLNYVSKALDNFCNYLSGAEWNTELRTECDNLIIAFSQLKDKYISQQALSQTIKESPVWVRASERFPVAGEVRSLKNFRKRDYATKEPIEITRYMSDSVEVNGTDKKFGVTTRFKDIEWLDETPSQQIDKLSYDDDMVELLEWLPNNYCQHDRLWVDIYHEQFPDNAIKYTTKGLIELFKNRNK